MTSSTYGDSPYRTTFHRDGSMTVWDVYQQQWRRRATVLPNEILASLGPDERERVLRHTAALRERAEAK